MTLVAWLQEYRPDHLVIRTDDGTAERDLYFKADRPVWGSRPEVLDFAAVALAQYAANRHLNLHIKGCVTRSQLDNLAEFLDIWSTWKPDCFQPITITADQEIELPRKSAPAVLAFSGGVDASYSLLANNNGMLGRLSVPVGLGVLVLGWDIRHGDSTGARIARSKAEATLSEFGSACVSIATNWQQDFCPVWFLGFNAGVACILQTLRDSYSCALFSSGLSYLEELTTGPFGSHIAVNHLLGSTSFPLITCGGRLTRLERIRAISSDPHLLSGLRVCYQEGASGKNCCHCEKCTRTQLEFIAVGVDPLLSFPELSTAADVENLNAVSIGVYAMLEELLKRFPPDHALRPALVSTVERARKRYAGDQPEAGLVDSLREEVASLRNSTSWKITTPLRRLKQCFASRD